MPKSTPCLRVLVCSNMDPNEFSDMDPNNCSEGSNKDESHYKVKECIFKVFPRASEQSKVIWIEIQPNGLQILALREGLEFHSLSTSRGQELLQRVKYKFRMKSRPFGLRSTQKTIEVN